MYYRDNLLDWWTIIECQPMQLLYIFIGAIATGIVGYWVYKYQMKGDVSIDQYKVNFMYQRKNEIKLIVSIDGSIVFLNKSGEPKIIKIVGMRFYDGKEFTKLDIKNFGLLPSITIEPKKEGQYDFVCGLEKPFYYPLLAIMDKVTYLEIEYSIGGRRVKFFIEGYELVEDWFIK